MEIWNSEILFKDKTAIEYSSLATTKKIRALPCHAAQSLINPCEKTTSYRVATDLENLEKSGNLQKNSKSLRKVREFCCLKFSFSQVEDPNFEDFLGEHATSPLNGPRLTVELNLGLEKSGNFILSGKWQPCSDIAIWLFLVYPMLLRYLLRKIHL